MLYLIVLVLMLLLAYIHRVEKRERDQERSEHAAERATWAKERQNLLDRIQAPLAAQVAATEALMGLGGDQLTEEERLRLLAESRGLSIDDLRTPPGWSSPSW